MTYWKIGLHNAGVTGERTGYDDYLTATAVANQPAIVQSVDNAGVILDVQKRNNPHDVMVFRFSGNELDMPGYDTEAVLWANKRYDDIYRVWPPELDPHRVYTLNLNEPEHKLENAQDVEWVAAVTLQHAKRAVADGHRFCGYGWSGGTPEQWFWELPDTLAFLRLCAQYPDLLAVGLHEYSFDDDMTDNHPYLVGRFQFLHDVCDDHNIPYPKIIIGEFGLREASFNPKPTNFTEQMCWAQSLYGQYDNILGAMLWTIGGWGGTVVKQVIDYIPELCEMIRNYDGAVGGLPVDPPTPTPKPETAVLSFGNGWTDDPLQPDRRQIPSGFELRVTPSGQPLWYGDTNATGEVEAMHRLADQLPPDEQLGGANALILDGDATYKIQAVNMASGTALVYRHATEHPLQVTVPIQCHYQAPDSYGRVPPLEADDVYVALLLNGNEVIRLQFPDLLDREWMNLEGWAVPVNGVVTIELRFATKWRNSRDLWTDKWTLTTQPIVAEPADGRPRVQYARNCQIVPQATSLERYLEIATAAFNEKRTVGFSYDDGGIGALDDKTAVLWDMQPDQKQVFFDWYATYYPGTTIKFAPDTEPMTPAAPFPANDGWPRVQYAREYHVAPQDATLAEWLFICKAAFTSKRTVGFSYDDAGIGALDDKTAVLYDIEPDQRQTFLSWYDEHYPGTSVVFRQTATPPETAVSFVYRPCDTDRITQPFGANPANYAEFGLPGHEGIDYGVAQGWPYYAVADGTVIHASDRQWSRPTMPSNYGWHVVVDHGAYCTVYAHAQANLPVSVGQSVKAGGKVGLSGNTGNSHGYHLHFGLLDKTETIDPDNGYPVWKYGRPVNPAPFLLGLQPPPAKPTPPTGDAMLGLHASADPGDLYGRTAEVNEFGELWRAADGEMVVKVLSGHSVKAIQQLAQACPGAHWIIRAFLHFGDRTITPSQFFNDTISDTRRAVETLNDLGIRDEFITIELHNEPNLKQEGWGKSWANGREFGNWLLEVLRLYRLQLPTVRYMYPGLSPGGDIAGIRTDSTRFLNDGATAVAACDALAAHCYWSQGWPMHTALSWLDWHSGFNKPVWVTEASRNDRPVIVPETQYADEYVQFWQECRKRPFVQGVTYFVASASNGYFHPECWIVDNRSRGIAAEMRRLAG